MPLLRKKKTYSKGDLLVYYYLGSFEDCGDDIDIDAPINIENLTTLCTLVLAEYQGTAELKDAEEGETRVYLVTKELASCDYALGEAQGEFVLACVQEYVDPEWILGTVCGTLDLKDPYAMRSYLGRVWHKHYGIFEQGMKDITYQRLTEWGIYV